MRWLTLIAASTASLFAQLAPPNDIGVSIGHVHHFMADPDPAKALWVGSFGGRVTNTGSLEILSFPGIFVIVGKSRTPPTGGSNGSMVNHYGFLVKSYADTKAKLAKAALKVVMDNEKNKQTIVEFPEEVRVEFTEDSSIDVPVKFHHFHLATPNQVALRDWYVKTFGGKAGMRGQFPAAFFPGGEVDFMKADAPPLPTKGRALDHIGFELTGLEAFCKKLHGENVNFDMDYREMPQLGGLKISYVIDPEGTRIELTEGFRGK